MKGLHRPGYTGGRIPPPCHKVSLPHGWGPPSLPQEGGPSPFPQDEGPTFPYHKARYPPPLATRDVTPPLPYGGGLPPLHEQGDPPPPCHKNVDPPCNKVWTPVKTWGAPHPCLKGEEPSLCRKVGDILQTAASVGTRYADARKSKVHDLQSTWNEPPTSSSTTACSCSRTGWTPTISTSRCTAFHLSQGIGTTGKAHTLGTILHVCLITRLLGTRYMGRV